MVQWSEPAPIHVHQRMRVAEPRSAPVRRGTTGGPIKLLVVPERGDQTLVAVSLSPGVPYTVHDVLVKLSTSLHVEVVNAYLVKDPEVRYVVTVLPLRVVRRRFGSGPRYLKSRTSVASCSYLRKNASVCKVKTKDTTGRLTHYLRRNIQMIVTYPSHPCKGAITVTIEDFKCLNDGKYLNDIIIDFYLKYLMLEYLPPKYKNRIYIFNTYFFTRLSSPKFNLSQHKPLAATRHAEVKRWTKNVNIFEKEFVIVPINQRAHWFLAVICYPGLTVMKTRRSSSRCGGTESPSRVPCILIFDSMGSLLLERRDVVRELKSYLICECMEKTGVNIEPWVNDIAVVYPSVPQQFNSSDCGLYLLQYVEYFFKDFILEKKNPFPMKSLEDWFEPDVIKRKRKEIKTLLIHLATGL